MADVKLIIDGIEVTVDSNATIVEAAKMINIDIPTLCYHPDQSIKGSCRVCIVEVEGQNTFTAACCTPVRNGMVVKTNTEKIREARKTILQLILANHNCECLTCIRNNNCELQSLCRKLNVESVPMDKFVDNLPIDESNPSIVRDPSKCIKCGRCVEVCHEVQGVGAIYNINRSCDMRIAPAFGKRLDEVQCVFCGQCINVCPVGAIYEKNDTDRVWKVLEDDKKHVVVQIAPAVRVALGEEFGMKPGSIITGKIVSFLKRIGFDKVFDTNFTADLTIIEEGNELLHRMNNNGKLPMLTSCSPGWIRFIELFYPDLLPHLSSCKSPQQMFGSLSKSYYAEKYSYDPKDIIVVSIMPCTAKKSEAKRNEMHSDGYQDVDIVITTRELASMIRKSGIRIEDLTPVDFDLPFGISTGAAVIFGASGGVMEAALRTVYEVVTGDTLEQVNFNDLRGIEGFKEATVNVGDIDVKVAVVNGLSNARMILDMIRNGKADYHFIEVMCCPGGCIGGGGQPIPTTNAIKDKRVEAIYNIDGQCAIRKSHENPVINTLYEEFLGEPLGEVSHKYLHTHYEDKSNT
ncbi:MAG: NADH-dependent [FeFe] hydrogenase, group A6 [Lutisporaceae bacterium]